MVHGFPAMTAFLGFMHALERKLHVAGIPLRLHKVGVICHDHHEQVSIGPFHRSFNLMRAPLGKKGVTQPIIEEGRTHLCLTLVFEVSEKDTAGALAEGTKLDAWSRTIEQMVLAMRIAGGTIIPTPRHPFVCTTPWIGIVPSDAQEAAQVFRAWRRQWLPGFALVGRDDLMQQTLQDLQTTCPQATLLDAWLKACSFNLQALPCPTDGANQKVKWADPVRTRGSGWIVPIGIGYAGLSKRYAPGVMKNSRDTSVPSRFVEPIFGIGQWISPHRVDNIEHLFWHSEMDESKQLYRLRNQYQITSSFN